MWTTRPGGQDAAAAGLVLFVDDPEDPDDPEDFDPASAGFVEVSLAGAEPPSFAPSLPDEPSLAGPDADASAAAVAPARLSVR